MNKYNSDTHHAEPEMIEKLMTDELRTVLSLLYQQMSSHAAIALLEGKCQRLRAVVRRDDAYSSGSVLIT